MKEVHYENNSTCCRVVNSVFFTSQTALHIIWGTTTSTSDFLLHWWRYFKNLRFIQVKCSENHPPSGCFQLDVQKCPVALEALDDFQPLSPTLGTHTCPCQWNWWKFCLKKVCSTGLAPICFPSCITKCLFTFFSLCPTWTIKPLSHFAFISNQFYSLVHWLAQSFITLRFQKGKNVIKTPEDVEIHMLEFTVLQGCPLIWWIPWVLCMCVCVLISIFSSNGIY